MAGRKLRTVHAAIGGRRLTATRSLDGSLILADRICGKPLPEEDGAFRLAAEDDPRPARWARLAPAIGW